MECRERLLSTIRAARPVVEAPGVLVVGSEVPNLLQAAAASMLAVSQNLDLGVQDPSDAYVYDDDRLPLFVFGAPSLVSRGVGLLQRLEETAR